MAKLTDTELAELTRRTLGHYDGNAEQFWLGTRDHDVAQNIDALLRAIDAAPPFGSRNWRILDLGCGPGRDLAAFKALGHEAVGLDGAARFCAMARDHTGCEVLHQDFLRLNLPPASFHGVFANASLFHVPSQELPRVLVALREALLPRGVLFASNPRGDNIEGYNSERYGSYHDLDAWRRYLGEAGFEEVEHFFRPSGLPRHRQPWLASTWRRS